MKKFIKFAFVAAFAAIAGYGVYTSQKSDSVSDLLLANVEALAGGGEIGRYTTHTATCPYPLQYKTSVSCSYGGSDETCNPSDC